MAVATGRRVAEMMAEFIVGGDMPAAARGRAAVAFCDTIGVILAGASEPPATIARSAMVGGSQGVCRVLGTAVSAAPADAAFANAVAAHALDYDDMCFVSLAHPSCALIPAALAAGETVRAAGPAIVDAYIAGFEVECRLGMVMNPRHYHVRGWHCTSSIGTLGAAAAAARILGLSAARTVHALGIAASSACGLKENLGAMVKPLHAGLAARNGVMAARLAREGFTASAQTIEGPQGYLVAMDSEQPPSALVGAVSDLGSRWEILDTGITVKLYPSCAATHPPLDALLDLQAVHRFSAAEVEAVDVEVDSMTPRLLIHDRPSSALEGKFSMPFCAAAALVFGHPSIATFEVARIRDPSVQRLMPLVTLRANPAFDAAAPLSQATVTVRLRDGRVVSAHADGARGYPGRLSGDELTRKFRDCAGRALSPAAAGQALDAVRRIGQQTDIRALTAACVIESTE